MISLSTRYSARRRLCRGSKRLIPWVAQAVESSVTGVARWLGLKQLLAGETFRSGAYLAVLCLVAGGRVFLGTAGLPLFTNVDEHCHFDLVRKVARGCWPDRRQWSLDSETSQIIGWYASTEFLARPENRYEAYPPPRWLLPPSPSRDDFVHQLTSQFAATRNWEAHSPPVYFVLAGLWLDLGQCAGWTGPQSVYWVRFLNIPLFAALIVAAYGFCRAYFPAWVAYAVPAMLALLPSTTYYYVNNDVLSPLAMLLALWALLRWHEQPGDGWRGGGRRGGRGDRPRETDQSGDTRRLRPLFGELSIQGMERRNVCAGAAGGHNRRLFRGPAACRLGAAQSLAAGRLDGEWAEDGLFRLAGQAVETVVRPPLVFAGWRASVLAGLYHQLLQRRGLVARRSSYGSLFVQIPSLVFPGDGAVGNGCLFLRPSPAGGNVVLSCGHGFHGDNHLFHWDADVVVVAIRVHLQGFAVARPSLFQRRTIDLRRIGSRDRFVPSRCCRADAPQHEGDSDCRGAVPGGHGDSPGLVLPVDTRQPAQLVSFQRLIRKL